MSPKDEKQEQVQSPNKSLNNQYERKNTMIKPKTKLNKQDSESDEEVIKVKKKKRVIELSEKSSVRVK